MTHLRTVEKEHNILVNEDGEILNIETKRKQIVVNSSTEYFTTYINIIGILNNLSGSAYKLASYLIMNAPINNNYSTINSTYRNKIAEDIGVKPTYVKALLKELCDKNILIKDNSSARNGGYYINPEYYWKGDMSGRNKAMKFLLELKYEPTQD